MGICMEFVSTFFEAMAPFKWPLLVLFFSLIFRRPISSLISRVSGISAGQKGISVETIHQQDKETVGKANQLKGGLTENVSQEIDPGSNEESYKQLMEFRTSATRDDNEQRIEEVLAGYDLDDAQGKKVLIRNLAHERMISEFLRISMHVFGSQLDLLAQLNEHFSVGIKNEAIHSFYDNVRSTYAQQFDSWDLKTYLRYLVEGASLVRLEDDRLHITDKGREYLIWRIEHSLAKPGY